MKTLQILSTPMLVRGNPFIKAAVSLAGVKGRRKKPFTTSVDLVTCASTHYAIAFLIEGSST